MADAIRVFFALWPDAAARDALATLAAAVGRQAGGRAPPAGNLHLTLAFVGETPTSRVAALEAIGVAAASAVLPFPLTLDRIGAFPAAGIAWAGPSAPPLEIVQLATRLGEGLAAEGFAVERRALHPHVTLARRCRRRQGDTSTTPITWTVARLALNVSDLSSGGPQYRELAGWPLGSHAAA